MVLPMGEYLTAQNLWVCANKAWNIHILITDIYSMLSMFFIAFLYFSCIPKEKLEHCSSEANP